jgi:hypothetical protein
MIPPGQKDPLATRDPSDRTNQETAEFKPAETHDVQATLDPGAENGRDFTRQTRQEAWA